MSEPFRLTKHPKTGKWEIARWIDDYFAPRRYGVQFPNDEKVYSPLEYVLETK